MNYFASLTFCLFIASFWSIWSFFSFFLSFSCCFWACSLFFLSLNFYFSLRVLSLRSFIISVFLIPLDFNFLSTVFFLPWLDYFLSANLLGVAIKVLRPLDFFAKNGLFPALNPMVSGTKSLKGLTFLFFLPPFFLNSSSVGKTSSSTPAANPIISDSCFWIVCSYLLGLPLFFYC